MITERLGGGRKQKAKAGGYSGGNIAIGYTAKRGAKKLVVDKEKIATVRRAFELHNDGLTLQAVADILNSEGHTTKQGAKFHAMQVMRIVNRKSFYEGVYSYAGVVADGEHQAII